MFIRRVLQDSDAIFSRNCVWWRRYPILPETNFEFGVPFTFIVDIVGPNPFKSIAWNSKQNISILHFAFEKWISIKTQKYHILYRQISPISCNFQYITVSDIKLHFPLHALYSTYLGCKWLGQLCPRYDHRR